MYIKHKEIKLISTMKQYNTTTLSMQRRNMANLKKKTMYNSLFFSLELFLKFNLAYCTSYSVFEYRLPSITPSTAT